MIRDHEDVFERQARRYDRPLDTWAELEREAFGLAVGSNGYTILAEAEELARLSEAKVAGPVLDLGTGRGWPGWLVAERGRITACAGGVHCAWALFTNAGHCL